MNYQIVIPKPVQKQLGILPENIKGKIIEQVLKLKENPRSFGSVKLKSYENEYRIRVGDYRIRYEIDDNNHTVILLHCKHRKDIYRT
ncbi:MAG: type II toxin-antitoxin system RelE/ParE family toxin [Ignavibacteriales bacterium]|nr:type II toxin-antitoxin system RelE/ParE family toxin [Ignavibacteriales bacterium]